VSSLAKHFISSLLLVAGLSVLGGCGSSDKNGQAVFDEDDAQHPANWLITGHSAAALANPSVCTECHGISSGGTSGLACESCHTFGNPLAVPGCLSCHGDPPDGTVYPNIASAHNANTGHFAPQVTLPDSCNTCHNGAGTGTANHFRGFVTVQFLSIYNAKSGTAVYNADGTCSNVSCHGGQTTPAFLTGSIQVDNQCTSCHAFGTSEYNSYVSGEHFLHVSTLGFPCTFCHDPQLLIVNHFTTLNTPTTQAPASATIYNTGSWMTYTNGSCTPVCHVTRTW
jgi:predicted CxxxxCH...CXXCH cytochrome family protein